MFAPLPAPLAARGGEVSGQSTQVTRQVRAVLKVREVCLVHGCGEEPVRAVLAHVVTQRVLPHGDCQGECQACHQGLGGGKSLCSRGR